MSKIKQILKKHKIIYKPLYILNKFVIKPLLNGYYSYYFIYIFQIKKKDISYLDTQGFTKVKPYKYYYWRIGRGSDSAHRRYYKAIFNGETSFIKLGENDETVINEIHVYNYLKNMNNRYSPKFVNSDLILSQRKGYIALEFVNSLDNIPNPENKEDFISLCKKFIDLHNYLVENEILHADIHRGNLLTDSLGNLKLIDYGISFVLDETNNINYKKRPGTFYLECGNQRIYDDAYSLLKLLDQLTDIESFKNETLYLRLKDLVGIKTKIVKID